MDEKERSMHLLHYRCQEIKSFISAISTGSFEEVKCAAQNFLDSVEEIDFDKVEPLLKALFSMLVKYGFVPPVPAGNDREIDRNDFTETLEKVVLACKCLRVVLSKVHWPSLKPFLVDLIIFCGQHAENSLWSQKESMQQTKEILEFILTKHNCESFKHLLAATNSTSLSKNIFSYFLPYLTRFTWKCNPGMKVAFIWCLKHMSHPHMVEVFNEVLPPSLLFVDDFILENRISGIQCLHHILSNAPKSTFHWYGRGDVIYNALKNLVYCRDADVITVLYPCLLKVLSIIEVDPLKPAQIRKITRYDEIYCLLLKEMHHEQTILLRKAYSGHLHLFVNAMGITIARHLKMTIQVLLQYLEVYDGPGETTRLNCLTALQILISVVWPRLGTNIKAMARGITRLIYDLCYCQSEPTQKDAVVHKCVKILQQLNCIAPKAIVDNCKPLLDLTDEIAALVVINEIWKS